MDRRRKEECLDSFRTAKRDSTDPDAGPHADRIEERLELLDPRLLLLRVLVERGPQELQPVRAERTHQRPLRNVRIRHGAQEKQDEHSEIEDDVPGPGPEEERDPEQLQEGNQQSTW